jgi:DNA-binding Lrp family transcriptional regulator
MDKTDLLLCIQLLNNSRMPYRALAAKLNLSVNAVHKRVQLLIQSGVLRTFTTGLTLQYLGACQVTGFGPTSLDSIDDLVARAKANDLIYWLAFAGANYIYVGAYLRNISELGAFTNFLGKELGMANPTVGLMPSAKAKVKKLTPIDWKIIHALSRDSRKQISEIAKELRLSAKTVSRRLDRLKQESIIEFSYEWYPDKSNDIMPLIHLSLKTTSDRRATAQRLLAKYWPNLLFFFEFTNLPQLLVAFSWANSMNELQKLRDELQTDPDLKQVTVNILFNGLIFPTWRDKLVSEMAGVGSAQGER